MGETVVPKKFWHLTARVKSPFVRDGNNSRSRCQRFKSFVCESMADSLLSRSLRSH